MDMYDDIMVLVYAPNKQKKMKIAVPYLRTSTEEQSPELQLPQIEEFCKTQGWEIDKVFIEQKSGYKDESKREEFNKMIDYVKSVRDRKIIVVNMDRFSRQPPEEVLRLTKTLSSMYNVTLHAVEGDAWSNIIESTNRFKEMGFMGNALSEFLETVLKGLEHQRAYNESKEKSHRVKRAVRIVNGVTMSYKGKRWGDKGLPKQTVDRIILAYNEGKTIREIASTVQTTGKSGNMKPISKSVVHKYIQQYLSKKQRNNEDSQVI